jgi:hypothetical protein
MAQIDFGVNFIGRLHSDIGLGEAARQVLDTLKSSRIPVCEQALGEADLPYRVNLLSSSFPDILRLPERQRRLLTKGRYTVAQYYWELPRLKAEFQPALALADEL